MRDLFADVLHIEHNDNQHRNGNECADENHLSDVNAQHTCSGQRTGCRRNQAVCQLKAAGQSKRKTDHGDAGYRGKSLDQRSEDNDRRIRENRNSNNPAGYRQRPVNVFFTKLFNKGKCQPFRGSRRFQNAAHHDAEADDDAGTFQRIAEAVLNGSDHACCRICIRDNVIDRHASDQSRNQRRQKKRDKCMNLCFHDQEDHQRNSDDESEYHSGCITHLFLPFLYPFSENSLS